LLKNINKLCFVIIIVKLNTATNNLVTQHHKMFTHFQFYKIDIDNFIS